MKYVNIRKKLDLSQSEIGILFGVPLGSIKNWEQGLRSPDSAADTLYRLVEGNDYDTLSTLVHLASNKQYHDLKDIQTVKRLITKLVMDSTCRSLLELTLMNSNRQFTPVQLGFKVTEISPCSR